jgi:DNA-binding MarR family transcriptional regulator
MQADQDQPEPATPESVGAILYGLVVAGIRRRRQNVHLTAFATLASLGRTSPRRITDLAAIQGITQPAMTILVKKLEQAGLVERAPDPDDRRAALVSLTAAGEQLLRERREDGVREFAWLVGRLSPEEQAALAAALPALEHLHYLEQQERDPAAVRPGPHAPG